MFASEPHINGIIRCFFFRPKKLKTITELSFIIKPKHFQSLNKRMHGNLQNQPRKTLREIKLGTPIYRGVGGGG